VDYPYNGWLFLQFKKQTFYSPWKGYSIGLQIGTTGANETLSKPMQNLYHKYILDLPLLSWVNYQPQAFHLNFISEYYNGFKFYKKIYFLSKSELFLGTYESYFATRFGFQFGNINNHSFFNNSFLNLDNSISFYLGNKFEYSFHRYAFSGSLLRKNSLFNYNQLKLNHQIEFGVLYNKRNWLLTALINSKSKDFNIQRYQRHTYLTIIISRIF